MTDSFQDNLLSPPVYTRPKKYKNWGVPEVLFSGDPKKIEKWRMEKSIESTKKKRPDLLYIKVPIKFTIIYFFNYICTFLSNLFKGVVLQKRGSGSTETFTIRKMSGSIGVERIFPINSPSLQKIEVNKRGKVRRARIFYFRNLTGKKAKIKELV